MIDISKIPIKKKKTTFPQRMPSILTMEEQRSMLEGYVCELAELAQWGDGRLTQVLKEVDQLPNSQVRDESATVLVAIRRTQREIRAKNAANEAIARMLRGEIKPRW